MENSSKSIAMAEKRVGEMNKLMQGLLEQSNRYLRQKNQPQDTPRQNRTSPQSAQMQNNQRQNMQGTQRSNVPFRNNGFQNRQGNAPAPPKPRFETVENGWQRTPHPEPPKPTQAPQAPPIQNHQESLLPISLNSDTALIAALAAVLVREKADTKLILALLYILL